MRLEAKRAKGPAGVLVPEDVPSPSAAAAPEPDHSEAARPLSDTPVAGGAFGRPAKDEVAARLEAALKGHLENVASALASWRTAPSPSTGTAGTLPGRSIYAPARPGLAADTAKEEHIGVHLPKVTLLETEPLPPPSSPLLAVPGADNAPRYPEPEYDAGPYDEEGGEEFGHAPLSWMNGEEEPEDDPLPAALMRQSRRDAEPVAHLPPLVEPAAGVSARTLAVAALFGLATGVGAIAAYQFSVAPVAAPSVAVAPAHPADTSRIVKLDADRVPQSGGDAAVKVAAATVVPKLRTATQAPVDAPPAVAATDADAAASPPVVATPPAAGLAASDPASPALRQTEDASAAAAVADEAPSDTEPFVATAAIRPAQPRKPAADGQVLAYAPTPQPNDPVGRSFFGKDDEAAPAPKKSAAAKVPAPAPGKAKVLMAVNMRAKPDNDAPSVKILGAGSRVEVVKCDGWCEVVADGKHGYVFKKFLDN